MTDVSEQRLAYQKRHLLTSGSLTESELEEIKREAAQDGKPVSVLLSVTTDVCPGVQMSTLDVVSALSADSSVITPLCLTMCHLAWLQSGWRLLHVVGSLLCQ